MALEYDITVRLMDEAESFQDLCGKFLCTDEEGRPCLDFGKIVMTEQEQRAAQIRKRLSDTPGAASQDDLEFLRRHEQIKKEIQSEDEPSGCKSHYSAENFRFPSPQLMRFYNRRSTMVWEVHSLAILIKKPLRFSWMELQLAHCGWCYIEPDGGISGDSCNFESGLAPEWLWVDQGCGDSSWAQEWLNILCGREQDAKPN